MTIAMFTKCRFKKYLTFKAAPQRQYVSYRYFLKREREEIENLKSNAKCNCELCISKTAWRTNQTF